MTWTFCRQDVSNDNKTDETTGQDGEKDTGGDADIDFDFSQKKKKKKKKVSAKNTTTCTTNGDHCYNLLLC